MNRQPALDSWASGELFGISEQFARGGIELSGISGWFALAPGQLSGNSGYLRLAPAAQILPRGDHPRHATGQSSHATDELSRRPDHPAEPPSQSAGLTGRLAGRPGGLAGRPGELSRRPSQLSRRPDEPDGRPSEPDGPGAARREGVAARRRPGAAPRSPAVARRKGMDGPRKGVDGARTGLDGPRRPGAARRGGGVVALARAVFAPAGRRAVATGGAEGRRPERNPWTGAGHTLSAPAGRRSSRINMAASVDADFLCPSGAGEIFIDAFHGLRDGQSTVAPPVATALDPSGVEGDGAARAIGARARAGGRLFSAGVVPVGRHAPLASADPHAGGSVTGVRHGA